MIKDRIFARFLLSYIIVLLIPLAIGITAYREALRVVEQDAQEANLASLKQCMSALDSRFEEVENIATKLALDSDVLRFANENNTDLDRTVPIKINNIKEKVFPFTQNNSFISISAISFNKSNVVISNNRAYLDQNEWYEKFFIYNNTSYTDWNEKIVGRNQYKAYFPVAPVKFRNEYNPANWKEQPMLMYMQSFPVIGTLKGQIMILIPSLKIYKLLGDIGLEQKSIVYILDDKEKVLASYSGDESILNSDINMKELKFENDNGFFRQSISGRDMIIAYTKSHFNGWRYIAAIPYKVVVQKVEYIRWMILIILLLSVCFGILGAFLMAYRNSRPIKNIITIIRELAEFNDTNTDSRNDYNYLRKSILKLVSNNKSMEDNLNKQMKMLKTIFVEKLVKGEFSTLDEVHFYLQQLGMMRFDGKFVVMIAHVQQPGESGGMYMPQESSAIKMLIKDFIENFTGVESYFHELDFDKRAFILNINVNDYNKARLFVENIINETYRNLLELQKIKVSFSIGSPVDNYLGVGRSFDEAKEALQYNASNETRQILWYQDIPRKSESYYYPVDVEMLLINYTKFGNIKDAKKIIKRIYKENYEKCTISTALSKCLSNEMQNTVLKIMNILSSAYHMESEEIKQKLALFESCASKNDAFLLISEIYEDICSIIRDNNKNSKCNGVYEILSYLDDNYADSQMSLTLLAERFNFAPAYLSQLFKEEIGENFSVYLEKTRIKKACELLKAGEAVNIVSKSVGYNDVHSFRNAFKKVIGFAPSNYKDNVKEQDGLLDLRA